MTSRNENGSAPGGSLPPDNDPDQEDHYSLLGVAYLATNAEIMQAYRRTMLRAHPDRQAPERRAAAEVLARQLNAAYAVLSDPIKRQAYDRTIRQQVVQDQIMRQYVGGFYTGGASTPQPPPAAPREPTAAERRERIAADRRSWLLLLGFATLFAVLIIAVLVVSSLFESLLHVFQ
ncbi:MAG: J domain-containing protein [Thermomicrobiales bacterium]